MATVPLHEFMAAHRDELLAASVAELRSVSAQYTDDEVTSHLGLLLDEVIRALQKVAGLPVSSPLPQRSEAAASYGASRQRRGFAISNIARDLGSISKALGDVGMRGGASFTAADYRVFNECFDNALGSALEQYWVGARGQQEKEHAQYVGFLAHELRNALATARMAFGSMQRNEGTLHERAQTILERSLGRLADLVDQTLLAVRLDAPTASPRERIDVRALLCELRDAAVPERGIDLKVQVDEPLEVTVDERLLVSALGNLLQNAIKFTRPGGHVVLRARKRGDAILIEVEDECGGLPEGAVEELFQPFVQRAVDRRGLGLGLTITRDALAAMGGEIGVRNLPGKGCVFAVTLR
jgi:signal transduction histidine kinase